MLARVGGNAAAATALLAFGGTAALASAGALPDAAQNGLSRAMARVGIHLPASDGAPRPTVPEPDEPAPPQPGTGPTSDTDAGHDEPAGPPASVPARPPAAVPQGPDDTPAVTAPGRGGAPGHGG